MELQVLYPYLMKPDTASYLHQMNTADSLRHCLSKNHFNISPVSINFLVEFLCALCLSTVNIYLFKYF
jgi:hypothetical protein